MQNPGSHDLKNQQTKNPINHNYITWTVVMDYASHSCNKKA